MTKADRLVSNSKFLADYYMKNMTLEELAKRYNAHVNTIQKVSKLPEFLKKIERLKKKNDEQIDKMLEQIEKNGIEALAKFCDYVAKGKSTIKDEKKVKLVLDTVAKVSKKLSDKVEQDVTYEIVPAPKVGEE